MANRGSAAENVRRGLVRFIGPGILAAEVALVAVLAVLLAKAGWLMLEPGGAVSMPQPLAQNARASEAQARTDLSGDPALLVTSNPFISSEQPVADIPEAPETKLNLILKGVRASAEGSGVAMIVMPDNRLHIFAPGERILDGVVLDRVFGDRVTLRKDGQIEALLMASGADRLAVLSSPDSPAGATVPSSANLTTVGSSAGTGGSAADAAGAFLANLVINPVHHGQDFVGYEVGSRGDTALLERSGLRAGDIVTAIGGTPAGSIAPGELAVRLASEKTIRLQIDRDGRQIDQTFTLPEKP